jgi:hypothetical protein
MNLPNHGDKLIYTPIGAEFRFIAPAITDKNIWIVENCATGELWKVFATDVKPIPKETTYYTPIFLDIHQRPYCGDLYESVKAAEDDNQYEVYISIVPITITL